MRTEALPPHAFNPVILSAKEKQVRVPFLPWLAVRLRCLQQTASPARNPPPFHRNCRELLRQCSSRKILMVPTTMNSSILTVCDDAADAEPPKPKWCRDGTKPSSTKNLRHPAPAETEPELSKPEPTTGNNKIPWQVLGTKLGPLQYRKIYPTCP